MTDPQTTTTTTKLESLTPLIQRISKASGTLGLSVGVIHHGRVVYKTHVGQRNPSSPDPPNEETVYYLSSLTKAVTSAMVALLVDEGKLDWDTPVVDAYVPELATRDDEVGRRATLVDFLSHRTGLARGSAFWVQRRQEFITPKRETVGVVVGLRSSVPFRSAFLYNNWGYGVVEAVVERVTGRDFCEVVQERILRPLGLKSATFGLLDARSNVTSANTNWSDGTFCPLKVPPQSDRTGLAAAGALKMSLDDSLRIYQSLLSMYTTERTGQKSPSDSPFHNTKSLFEPRMPILPSEDVSRHGYALGWIRTVLPHTLGTIGFNTIYLSAENMPVIGTRSSGTVVLHHHGSLLGTLASVHLVPDTESAIVVLANTLGFSDVSDWIGQLILQTILNEPAHDYVYWSERARDAHFKKYADLKDSLERNKLENLKIRDLNVYCGRYRNRLGNFVIDISVLLPVEAEGEEKLKMKIQDMDTVVYELFPYANDTFYWPCDRDTEMCVEMMYPWTWEGVHKISFDVSDEGGTRMTRSLSWGHDASVPPEVFVRET